MSLTKPKDHSRDLPSTLDGPWVELHLVQYQTPTPTNQGIACFKNPWPTFVSSGEKFSSTPPHNYARKFNYSLSFRVVWAHTMQQISFISNSFQYFHLISYLCTRFKWDSDSNFWKDVNKICCVEWAQSTLKICRNPNFLGEFRDTLV